jgi:aspartyl-tRNA(Asn)/glutamyl-tRNA(Gln) amidotransferase subunit A
MMQQDVERLTISALAPLLRKKEISPVEVTRQFLDRVERLNPVLNAYLTICADDALAQAKKAEAEIAQGKYRGLLHGIPFSLKDNIASKGIRTTAGAKVLSDWVPDFDATVAANLKEAGGILIGKTNMHEWASGGTTINPFYGTTHNPWDLTRISGGSSGGSASAVAATLCLLSIGSDNMGSVRNPAAMCGVVGLKPTYGRVSRFGDVPGTGGDSTDHLGIFTKNVRDCAVVLQAIAGADTQDPLSAKEPVPDYLQGIGRNVSGLTAGIITNYFDKIVSKDVRELFTAALSKLQSLGVKIVEVSVPHLDLVTPVQNCTTWVERVASHIHYLRTRPRDYSPAFLHRQIASLTIPAETYVLAQKLRRVICREFEEVLEEVQIILTPTVETPAPTIEECNRGALEIDGRTVSLFGPKGNMNIQCTLPFNLTGLPAISVPCGFSPAGLPAGLQIVAAPFQESLLFQVAHAYEQAAGWCNSAPRL